MRTDPRLLRQLDTVCRLRQVAQDGAHVRLHEQRELLLQATERGRQADAREAAHRQAQAGRWQAGATVQPLDHHLGLAHARELQQLAQDAAAARALAEQAAEAARAEWLQARLQHEALAAERRRHLRAWLHRREREHERQLEERATPEGAQRGDDDAD